METDSFPYPRFLLGIPSSLLSTAEVEVTAADAGAEAGVAEAAAGAAEAEGGDDDDEEEAGNGKKCCSPEWWVYTLRGPTKPEGGEEPEEDGDDDEDSEDSDAPPPPSVSSERIALARKGDRAALEDQPACLKELVEEFCDYFSADEGVRDAAFARLLARADATTTRTPMEQLMKGPYDADVDNTFVMCVDSALLVEHKEKNLEGLMGVKTDLKIARTMTNVFFMCNWCLYYFALPFRWIEAWLDTKHKGEESPFEFDSLSASDKVAFLVNLPFKWIFFLTIPQCDNPRFTNWCVSLSSLSLSGSVLLHSSSRCSLTHSPS